MEYKYDVFISYSRKDYVDSNNNIIPKNAITEIQNLFDKENVTYWIDENGIYSGQEFIEIITNAIAESKMLIFISSEQSNKSNFTAGEILEALDNKKVIIPVKIDNSQFNKKFRLVILPLDFIDYQKNPQNALVDLLRAVNKTKEDIHQAFVKEKEEEKKGKIKSEIKELAEDCNRLIKQQKEIAKSIHEKQVSIGNKTKICPVCGNKISITSEFCNRCGCFFSVLYGIDEYDINILYKEHISVIRTNWCSINTMIKLESLVNSLKTKNAELQQQLYSIQQKMEQMKKEQIEEKLMLLKENQELHKKIKENEARGFLSKNKITQNKKKKIGYLGEVSEIILKCCSEKTIFSYYSLRQAQLDSNALTRILSEYGITFSTKDISRFNTIEDLKSAIWERR